MIWAKNNLRVGAALSLAVALAVALLALVVLAEPAQSARGADLTVRKSVSPKVVTVGNRQTFAITVKNVGNRRATNVVMRDPLPGIVRFVRASTSRQVPGSCGLRANRTVVCHLGTLRPGKTVRVWIFVRTVKAGTYVNRAFVSYRGARVFGASSDGQGSLQEQDATRGQVAAP